MSTKTQETIQRTLFEGAVNEQTQQTYYNHPPRTLYERFVEAHYYFNKEYVRHKDDIIRKANEEYVNEYLQKQKEDKLKIKNTAHCSLKPGFSISAALHIQMNLLSKRLKSHPLLNSALNHPPRLLLVLLAYYLSHLHQI